MLILKGFMLFLKNPNALDQIEIESYKSFFILIWKSFLILFLIDILVGLAISTPLRFLKLFPEQRGIDYNLFIILKITLFLPIIEELIFRLPLRISRRNLAISLSLILFGCLTRINLYLAISTSIALFNIIIFFIKDESIILNKLNSFTTKYFLQIFYFQALLFGLLHLTNYNLDIQYFYLFPFFVISYILTGCFLGYLRIKYNYGIYLCMTTHIVVNSLYCLVLV
jgi:hypothetical protein